MFLREVSNQRYLGGYEIHYSKTYESITRYSSCLAEEMNVIIEIPKFSKNKYEIDKETGLIKLDRAMHTAQDYPFDYGFVPQTLFDDGDALDVMLLTTYPLAPGILVKARPVAVMEMIDGGERDDKVLAVPIDDPRFDEIKDLADVNKHTIKEFTHFFETYKQVQKASRNWRMAWSRRS